MPLDSRPILRRYGRMAAPVVVLPLNLNGLTLSQVASEVGGHAKHGWPPELVFDFSKLGFVRPAGVVFLSNLVYWLAEKRTRVKFIKADGDSDALRFLDDSLFFEQHCGEKVRSAAAPRGTTRPLVQVAHKDSHDWLQTNLVPWLAGRLSITEASLYSLKACISELFNNIQDHTRYDIGSIFVQHFPRENRVQTAISDFGRGIPRNVRTKVADLTDAQAIIKAVEEGFTTKSTPANQGIGLDYLLKTVVQGNGGQVTIYSGTGIVQFRRSGSAVQPRTLPNVGFCPGTTIDITLRTDAIVILPQEREELEW